LKIKTHTIKIILQSVFFITVLFLISSCSNNNQENNLLSSSGSETSNTDTLISPVSVLITNPITTLSDTCPPPRSIIVPITTVYQTITLNNGKILKLAPPETKTADFLSLMQTYSTDNGLALDQIGCAIRDKTGNLWFATYGGGVSRYDGKSFTNFTTAKGLANNVVRSITEDKTGNLWFGTDDGVSRYDGKSFTNYRTAQGLANNVIRSITEDKTGNLWFGTSGGGVSRYDGKSFTNFTTAQGLANNTVWSITEDKTGNLWFGTQGGGVSRYDGKSFTNFTTVQGLANNIVLSIIEDKTGNLWFGTYVGVSRYDGKSFMNFTTAQGLANNVVLSITEDKTGNLWIGTQGGGVSCYDGKFFTNFTTAQGLANNIVWSITEDKTGNLWFGTYGGGVSRYEGKSFTNFTTAQGLSNNSVRSITEDKTGNFWFGTDGGGVCRYDGKSFTNFTTAQGLANNVVLSITEDKTGSLWFGTNAGGVSRYDGKSFTNFTTAQGLPDNTVWSIMEDKTGNLWFGTDGGGVSRFDGKSFTNYTTAQGLANNVVRSITEDKTGNLWFGTQGGVSCYDGKSFMNFTTAQGLANNSVRSITEDKTGNLWFGTAGGGVSRYDGKSFTNFTTAQGLPDNNVVQVVITKEQNIAIGTNFGMAVVVSFTPKHALSGAEGVKAEGKQNNVPPQNNLNNEELKNYTPVFGIYNSSTGYPVKDVNAGQNSMFSDSKGIIWIGTGSDKTALVRFDYAGLNKNNKPADVFIQSVKINNENICWYTFDKADSTVLAQQEILTFGTVLSEQERVIQRQRFSGIQFDNITKFYAIPENLVLPYENNNVTFDFVAIEPSKPFLVNYQYMLEGYDKEWSPILKKNSATFGNISEGSYIFKLKAQSPFGIWSDPIEYKFTVLPPWWRTWWMYSVYGIFVIGLFVLIVWWNGRRLRARAIELTEEVRIATVTIEEKNEKLGEALKDITDSINYALRIQQAILPDKKEVYLALPQSFILFKPKDIVSGDFYFFHKNDQSVFIAAVDCTGHGVPGAFMSMVGSERLTDAVQHSNNTSEILSRLNRGVKTSLKQSSKDESTRDGMDIAICSVDTKNRIVKYAGANRPMWIIRSGQTEVEEIKATKVAIGGLTEDNQHFDSHELKLQAGDTFYICTDGYADQFSGKDGKKLMTRKLKEILVGIQNKAMPEQELYLDNFVEDWKAGTEQVDDILVIGIRV